MFGHQDDTHHDNDQDDDQSADFGNETVQPENTSGQDWQHPGKPLDDDGQSPSDGLSPPPQVSADDSQSVSDNPVGAHSDGSDNDLIDIKQQALGQLKPLVGHLDQSPEEKFRTTMMMIQASDDKSLIETAYQAAKQITDEKARAQALLDIINEINYFTQQSEK